MGAAGSVSFQRNRRSSHHWLAPCMPFPSSPIKNASLIYYIFPRMIVPSIAQTTTMGDRHTIAMVQPINKSIRLGVCFSVRQGGLRLPAASLQRLPQVSRQQRGGRGGRKRDISFSKTTQSPPQGKKRYRRRVGDLPKPEAQQTFTVIHSRTSTGEGVRYEKLAFECFYDTSVRRPRRP